MIYVLGNHEFYDHDYDEILKYWTSRQNSGLHVLENKAISIDDFTFFGCVLWTDMEGGDGYAIRQSRMIMNDYALIRKSGKRLDPKDTMNIHQTSVEWLDHALASDDPNQVVISHHLPSFQSVASQFYDSPINGAFYSDLDWMIEKYQPSYWVHGHTHTSMDYSVGKTRIVCNPRGYFPKELNPQFRPDLILDLVPY